MARRDGTGPEGKGPLTGRGAGGCDNGTTYTPKKSSESPAKAIPGRGRGGTGRGVGKGRGARG